MANREKNSSPEIHCVYVETNLDTRLALPVHKDEIISDFKDKVLKEHKKVFPEIGEINISALKVKRRRKFYHFSESLNVCKAFDGISRNWFMYVDAVRVDKGEMLTIMATDQNRSNLELVEKKKEIAKDLTIEEGLGTEVVEKKTRKRRIISSDGKTSRKKSNVDLSQSAVAVTTELCGKLQGEVLTGADIESGEKNGVSTGDNQPTSVADRLLEEKILPVNLELVDGDTRGVVKDVPDNQTVKEALEKVDDLTGAIEQVDLEKGGKTADIVMIDQEKDLPPSSELVDGQITSQDDERGEGSKLAPSVVDNLQTADLVTNADNQLEASSGLTTGPATEKKRKRTKSSKDHIKQSTAAATKTSRKVVNEINEVPGIVDCVDATSKSFPIPERETLGNLLVEATQKETELGVKSVEDVGKDNMETDTLVSHPEYHLEANSELTTSPVTEKKKKRKKSSKDQINQSAAAATATTASREIVNEINGVPGNVDRVDATSESCLLSQRGNLGKENEIGEKINEDVGSGKAIPSSADNIQTDNLVSYPENQLEVSSGLTTSPVTEKKKRQRKSSKNDINKSTAATTTAKIIVNEREKVSGSLDCVDATSESIPNSKGEKLADALVDAIQNENEMGDKFVDKVGSGEATLMGADKIQAASNLQAAGMASTPHAFVQESKTLDHIGKFTDENASREHEVSKEKVEIDADQAKSVKSSKKKSSRKAKTPAAKEDTPVDSGAQNVEPIKVVDGEGHDSVIRNVLDSLQQRNEAEENIEKSGKKSSKRSKKKDSLNIVEEAQVVDSLQQKKEAEENLEKSEKKSSKRSKKKDSLNIVEEAQVLSVEGNNVAQEEASPINNPKDTDASFTPAKKNTESNASPLKKITEVTNNTEDINCSMQVLKENTDMGDNFGSSQKDDIVGVNKQDQVTGGAKSKKEKKSLDLHPGGSIDGSVKLKETKGRVQPSSSGTSQLQSRAKNDRSGSKVGHSDVFMKGVVNNKKEVVKKSSNSVPVNKSKMNVNNKKEAVKKSSNSVTANKSKTNFFMDVEDESNTTSNDSTKTPSDSSSDDDSDSAVTSSMPRKQGNNLAGGTNRLLGSLQDILRSSKSYKAAKLTASQSQPDDEDVVPDSQAI